MRHRKRDTKDIFKNLNNLKDAFSDAIWLIKRGYNKKSLVEFVSNRYRLNSLQRVALKKAAVLRYKRGVKSIKNRKIYIDGFNILITTETALSGGLLIKGYDGCCRDLSEVYGNYKTVYETKDALSLIIKALDSLSPKVVYFVFDKDVSNSIKVSKLAKDISKKSGLNIEILVTDRVDRFLKSKKDIVSTCDSEIIKNLKKWFNLSAFLFEKVYKNANILDLTKREGR